MSEPFALSINNDDTKIASIKIKLNSDSPFVTMAWSELYGLITDGFKVIGIEDIFKVKSGDEYYRELVLSKYDQEEITNRILR